jgi:hypothetical protein
LRFPLEEPQKMQMLFIFFIVQGKGNRIRII